MNQQLIYYQAANLFFSHKKKKKLLSAGRPLRKDRLEKKKI